MNLTPDEKWLAYIEEIGLPPQDKTAAEAYVQEAIESYQERNARDKDLWVDYGNEFCNWTADIFKLLDKNTVKKLRDFLRKNGVYIPKGRNVSMINALIACALEDEQSLWPEQELKQELEKGMNSSLDPKDPGAIRLARAKEIWAQEKREMDKCGVVNSNQVSADT
jgi:hypothetical protein